MFHSIFNPMKILLDTKLHSHYGVKINRTFRKNWKMNKRKEPTFEEFVDYLIETDVIFYDFAEIFHSSQYNIALTNNNF